MLDREGVILCNLISGIGFVKYQALCDALGSPAAIFETTGDDLAQVRGIGPVLAKKIGEFAALEELDKELALVNRSGVRLITILDDNYPDVLRHLYDPPLCLYVRGNLPAFPDNAVAIVGSRRMTGYGNRMTRLITEGAVAAGFVVVSGLAFGVDTVAHQTCVDNHAVTVAVLGGGLLRLHPQENVPLARAIIENNGAVVSEFPMTYPVSRSSFPRRNRIVAGLCAATVVTEANVDSGALITARLALEQGRDVFAVPGMADNPQARGCHQLIREGAGLIETFADVLNGMGIGYLPGLRPGESAEDGKSAYLPDAPADLSEPESMLCALLAANDLSIDELKEQSRLDNADLLATLMQLEMKMLIERNSAQIYRKR